MADSVTSLPRPIMVVYQDDEPMSVAGSKGVFDKRAEATARVGALDVSQFADNLKALCAQFGDVFETVALEVRSYELETVELTVDVSAKGELKFIGSVSAEVKGGLKLTFRRSARP